MNALRSVFPRVLLAALCAPLASCASVSSSHLDQQSGTYQQSNTSPGAQRPNLTIQSGEGEKLNLPWFVRDVQDMVNEGGAPADPARPPTYQ